MRERFGRRRRGAARAPRPRRRRSPLSRVVSWVTRSPRGAPVLVSLSLAAVVVGIAFGVAALAAAGGFVAGVAAVELGVRRPRPDGETSTVLLAEIERARRFGHPFAVARLPAPEDESGLDDRADRLVEVIRSVDQVWAEDDSLYVLLPETTRAGAQQFVDRLSRAGALLPDDPPLALACFPEDELTSIALLERLSKADEPGGQRIPLDAADPVPLEDLGRTAGDLRPDGRP